MTSETGSMLASSLRRLHRGEIKDANAVTHLLERIRDARIILRNGMDNRNKVRTAVVQAVDPKGVRLFARNIDPRRYPQIYFSFDLDQASYFFVAEPMGGGRPDEFLIHVPKAIYEAERRAVPRTLRNGGETPSRIEVQGAEGWRRIVSVVDSSYSGIGVAVPRDVAMELQASVQFRFLDGDRAAK